MWSLPKGEEFLPHVDVAALQRLYDRERKAKPKVRLLCALHRKRGESLDAIAGITALKRRTVHATLWRFVERGVDGKDSIRASGRPPRLSKPQRAQLVRLLDRGPPHNRSGLWTTKEVRELIRRKFGVTYTHAHVWDILGAAGFSIQTPRPRNVKAPDEAETQRFKKKLRCWQNTTGSKAS